MCDKCDKKFLLKHHATRHMKICINGKSEYFCKLCAEAVLHSCKKIKNNMRKPNIINFTVTFVTMLATEITNEDTQGQSIKK